MESGWRTTIEDSRIRLIRWILRNKIVSVIILLGAGVRVIFWWTLYPIWKHFATFVFFDLPTLEYIGDFQGYKPIRAPFYDVFSAASYLLTEPLFGIRAVTIFSLLTSILSIPLMFVVARRLFNRDVALFATILYALYPKFSVLSGRGMPEAAATGFVVFSLFALVDDSGSIRGNIAAGISVTGAYLLYIPAVVFGIYTGAVLLLQRLSSRTCFEMVSTPQLRGILAYVLVPFATGMMYLSFGPVRMILENVSGEAGNLTKSLFINPEAYGTIEKSFRYIVYMYFDFWWHMRGFDKEGNILGTINKLQSYLGEYSLLFFTVWTFITLLLTITILLGIFRLTRRRSIIDLYILGWIAFYIIVHTYKNFGWTGGFQFRHIFPVFPALVLTFGVGVQYIRRLLETRDIPAMASLKQQTTIDSQVLLQIITVAALVVLIVVASVQVQSTGENNRISMVEPVDELTAVTDQGDVVAATTKKNYHWTVLFSEGSVKPIVLVKDQEQSGSVESRTVAADIRVVPSSNISSVDADYLFITDQCGGFSDRQNRFADRALTAGGTEIYNRTLKRGSRCTVQTSIIEL